MTLQILLGIIQCFEYYLISIKSQLSNKNTKIRNAMLNARKNGSINNMYFTLLVYTLTNCLQILTVLLFRTTHMCV